MRKVMTMATLAWFGLATGNAMAEIGGSIEAVIGNADQEAKFSGYEPTSGDDTSIGVRGTVLFNPYFGLEASFFDYGEATDRYIDSYGDTITESTDVSSFGFGARGMIPLGSGFALNARAGVALWDLDYLYTDTYLPGWVLSDDDNGVDFYYGIGVQFDPAEHLRFAIEYTKLDMDVEIYSLDVDHEIENIAFSIGYVF